MSSSKNMNRSKQSGFSLIEVLISVLVLAIGLLGLGGLQLASLKGASNSHSRNVATMYAMELADRMRANPLGVQGGFYSGSISCGGKACRIDTFCTPAEVASFDLQEIMCGMKRASKREGGIKQLLLNGTLTVSCDGGCGVAKAAHNIRITWGETKAHEKLVEDSTARSLIVSVTP